MIYLIDDKKYRQEIDYLWTNERFNIFSNLIICIYTLEELHQRAKEIFSNNNIILYHESFIDKTHMSNDAIDKRNKLNAWSKNTQNLLVYFSGSKNTREINQNIAYIPVSTLYSNLEIFLKKEINNETNLDYLLFGENVNIEKDLNQKQDISLSLTFNEEPVNSIGSTFFIRPLKKYISNPFLNFETGIFFSDVSDEKFSEKINEWLNDIKYDNIFIPLCFGDILSDYNGLRLATHIRCSKNQNQITNIFIYGFVGIDYLLQNEYFDVLKTRNVFFVPYSKNKFLESGNFKKDLYHIDDLSDEIKKINLNIPRNYEDSHSIANEWAIYSWSKCIGLELTTEIETLIENINNNIYFKYLKTINPIQNENILKKSDLIIKNSEISKVLLIDDEVEKGWGELFAYLLNDINNIYFDYLGNGFKSSSNDQIVQIALKKIIDDDINIVILDFRLNSTDFTQSDTNQITSIKLLKEIKKFNPGIRVIIFSATNKIWNLQLLQDAGADGFVIKDTILNTHINNTRISILNFILLFENLTELNFLKEFYKNDFEIESKLLLRRKTNSTHPLPKEFIDESLKWLRLSNNVLNRGKLTETNIVSSFLFKFSVLENLSNRLIDVEKPILIGTNESANKIYKYQFRISEKRLRNFIEDENNPGYYRKTNKVYESKRNLPWVIKILNTIDFISEEKLNEDDLTAIVKKRNDFIHVNSTTGSKVEITIQDLIFLDNIIFLGLKNVI